jgi:hypothetical protein
MAALLDAQTAAVVVADEPLNNNSRLSIQKVGHLCRYHDQL